MSSTTVTLAPKPCRRRTRTPCLPSPPPRTIRLLGNGLQAENGVAELRMRLVILR